MITLLVISLDADRTHAPSRLDVYPCGDACGGGQAVGQLDLCKSKEKQGDTRRHPLVAMPVPSGNGSGERRLIYVNFFTVAVSCMAVFQSRRRRCHMALLLMLRQPVLADIV